MAGGQVLAKYTATISSIICIFQHRSICWHNQFESISQTGEIHCFFFVSLSKIQDSHLGLLNSILLEGLERNTEVDHTLAQLAAQSQQCLSACKILSGSTSDIATHTAHVFTQHSQASQHNTECNGRVLPAILTWHNRAKADHNSSMPIYRWMGIFKVKY